MIRSQVIPNKSCLTILIENCPNCGRPGLLYSHGSRVYGRRYVIRHGHGDCNFSWNTPGWDELDEIYRKVKQK